MIHMGIVAENFKARIMYNDKVVAHLTDLFKL